MELQFWWQKSYTNCKHTTRPYSTIESDWWRSVFRALFYVYPMYCAKRIFVHRTHGYSINNMVKFPPTTFTSQYLLWESDVANDPHFFRVCSSPWVDCLRVPSARRCCCLEVVHCFRVCSLPRVDTVVCLEVVSCFLERKGGNLRPISRMWPFCT